jgi:nucleoid DNA-binding protein
VRGAAGQGPHDHPSQGTCTRSDLCGRVRTLGFSHRDARRLVQSVFTAIADALADEEPVKLRRFGRLEVVDRAPRPARDLASGAPIVVEARRVVAFRPATHLRDRLDEALGEAPESR